MAPEVDFGKLSEKQIDQLIDAGQDTSGYLPYQTAVLRGLSLEGTPSSEEDWIVDISDEEVDKMEKVIGTNAPVVNKGSE